MRPTGILPAAGPLAVRRRRLPAFRLNPRYRRAPGEHRVSPPGPSSLQSVWVRGWTMDLGPENRLAALLLEEARRLRVQAEKEGVHAYLQKPNVRHRPNSRFLAATVLGVQQANRVVAVNEMWRAREKEVALESKMTTRVNGHIGSASQKRKNDSRDQSFSYKTEQDRPFAASCPSRDSRSSYSDQKDGLGEDEIEEFLHSRVKRGRAVGSRMDEPGPYLTAPAGRQDESRSPDAWVEEEWKRRVYGPEKPLFLKSKSSDEEPSSSKDKHRENKKNNGGNRDSERERGRRRGKPSVTAMNIEAEAGSDG